MASAAEALASSINDGINEWGVVHHSKTGEKIYAMEVCVCVCVVVCVG
jgi:meiotically up-regulated gene 157 (Mug157) protein